MRRYGKSRWLLLVGANAIVAVLVSLIYAMLQSQAQHTLTPVSGTPTSSRLGVGDPSFDSVYNSHPNVVTDHWLSWSLLDRKSGTMVGSDNWDKTSYLMSVIKPWIAADYLNAHPDPDDAVLDQLEKMIVDSNDQAAYQYFGGQPSWNRLVQTCGLTDIVERSWSWSLTEVSARDMVRLGDCIYSGRATTPAWTSWIVDKMRHVQGQGDFGPRELFSERTQVATKNGWFNWQGKWYINCLAITDNWVISVLQQWPYVGGDFSVGISQADPVCKSIASQVLRLNE